MSFQIKGDFFGSFKTGDNIRYNLSVLKKLYSLYNNPQVENKELLLKPIIVPLISIIEAILHDFHTRVRVNVSEGVIGLDDNVANYIRNKDFDEFDKYIESSKKHDLFKLSDTRYYDKLEELRKIRNRIHIQNTKKHLPADEYELFTEKNKSFAEFCLEIVVKTMHYNHPRPVGLSDYVGILEFPWDEHLPNFG